MGHFLVTIGSFQLMLTLCIATIWSLPLLVAAQKNGVAKQGCDYKCGDLEVPYPFGITEGCSIDDDHFLIKCNNDTNSGEGYRAVYGRNIPVINITTDGKLYIKQFIARNCYDDSGSVITKETQSPKLWTGKFRVSSTDNIFVAIGCDTYAWLQGYQPETGTPFRLGCMSLCENKTSVSNGKCLGNGCCQTSFDEGLSETNLTLGSFYNYSRMSYFGRCSYAFVVDKNEFNFNSTYFEIFRDIDMVPMVLDWTIGNDNCTMTQQNHGVTACDQANSECVDSENGPGYLCKCLKGYEGNPYLPYGCQDIDECKNLAQHNCTFPRECRNKEGSFECICQQGRSGPNCDPNVKSRIPVIVGIVSAVIILLLAISISSLWAFTKWKLMKVRENFFKKNGGILLQQKLSQKDGSSTSMVRIFSIDELEKATDGFSPKGVIGRGGFGTVYKGTLSGERMVAIKRSKIVDENQVEQFINEMVVLSRIDHRNVVRLIGCCLETEVPLLVYEFVPNGTLFDHIYDKDKASNLTWRIRLRIAAETARVLSYLHSEASIQIVHRDIKSTNVLLDDNYTAKVADFGASRLVPVDEEELTTIVQGTLGYLDPEYLRTNQLTTKSDVYSFGVLLVELLTAQKAISFDRPEEHRCLAAYFLSILKDERLMNVIDDCAKDGDVEQIKEVAHIARLCLKLNGEERPTMKEVALQLEGLTAREQHFWVGSENNFQETKYLLQGASHRSDYMDSVLEIWQPAEDGR